MGCIPYGLILLTVMLVTSLSWRKKSIIIRLNVILVTYIWCWCLALDVVDVTCHKSHLFWVLQCYAVDRILNGGASFRWSFGPLAAWGSIESTTILTTGPSLLFWACYFFQSTKVQTIKVQWPTNFSLFVFWSNWAQLWIFPIK